MNAFTFTSFSLALFCTSTWNSCFTVLDLKFFVASRQWPFFFQLPSKNDTHNRVRGTISIAQRLTCVLFLMRKYKHYAIRFATEDCYSIKENNNKEKFCQGKLSFCRRKLPFCWQKLRKAYFASAFFCWQKLPFCWCKLRKAYFASTFSCQGKKKSELNGLHLLWKMSTTLWLQR